MNITFNKPRRFFFHYNKILSKKGKPIISFHCNDTCYFISGDKLEINVPTKSKVNKRQPHVVIQGSCKTLYQTEDGRLSVS